MNGKPFRNYLVPQELIGVLLVSRGDEMTGGICGKETHVGLTRLFIERFVIQESPYLAGFYRSPAFFLLCSREIAFQTTIGMMIMMMISVTIFCYIYFTQSDELAIYGMLLLFSVCSKWSIGVRKARLSLYSLQHKQTASFEIENLMCRKTQKTRFHAFLFPISLFLLLPWEAKVHTSITDHPDHDDSSSDHSRVVWGMETLVCVKMLS